MAWMAWYGADGVGSAHPRWGIGVSGVPALHLKNKWLCVTFANSVRNFVPNNVSVTYCSKIIFTDFSENVSVVLSSV